MTEDKQEQDKENKPRGGGKISLQNWQIKNNTPDMYLAGLMFTLKNSDIQKEYDEKKLDREFKKFMDSPAFNVKIR